jgi:carbonic anhydrase
MGFDIASAPTRPSNTATERARGRPRSRIIQQEAHEMPTNATRRLALLTLAAGALAASACSKAPLTRSADVLTRTEQQGLTPDLVLADLKRGNDRYVSGDTIHRDHIAQAERTASGQYPKAIILGCLDSRVPPEVVFDQGIGDIFVGRVAGNIENQDMVGSMEFGTAVAGSKLIVVLGHTSCGAVKGAIDRVELDNLTYLLAEIEPAIGAVPHTPAERTSKNTAFVDAVTAENVRLTVRDIQSRSPVIADLVKRGELRVVGAVYDLHTGRVHWLES